MARRAIFYDTETTGIKPDKDRIIEIAAFDPLNDRSFVSLVNPGIPIAPEASAISGITDDHVKDAPPFSSVALQFNEFCEGDVILIAHNNDAFDVQFLQNEYARNQLQLPKWNYIDTLKWARRYRPDLPRHSLQFLREIYNIPANNAHRALDDVIILHKVFSFMTDDLDIETVFNLLNISQTITKMPFGKYQGMELALVPPDYVAWLSSSGSLDKPENKNLKEAFEKLGKLKTLSFV